MGEIKSGEIINDNLGLSSKGKNMVRKIKKDDAYWPDTDEKHWQVIGETETEFEIEILAE